MIPDLALASSSAVNPSFRARAISSRKPVSTRAMFCGAAMA